MRTNQPKTINAAFALGFAEGTQQTKELKLELDGLREDLDKARAFAQDAATKYNALLEAGRVLRCAFCDAEYADGTPATQHDALTAHVLVCQKHPYAALLEKLKAAEVELGRRFLQSMQPLTPRCTIAQGCVRADGHPSFHTTSIAVASQEDQGS